MFGGDGSAAPWHGRTRALTRLRAQLKNMTCRELLKPAAKIIMQVHDSLKDKEYNLFLSWVSTTGTVRPPPSCPRRVVGTRRSSSRWMAVLCV